MHNSCTFIFNINKKNILSNIRCLKDLFSVLLPVSRRLFTLFGVLSLRAIFEIFLYQLILLYPVNDLLRPCRESPAAFSTLSLPLTHPPPSPFSFLSLSPSLESMSVPVRLSLSVCLLLCDRAQCAKVEISTHRVASRLATTPQSFLCCMPH